MAIFTLIEEEAGFLSVDNFGFKAQTVLEKNHRLGEWRAVQYLAVL